MYFSKHNENVTFSYTYGSALEVEAKGSVCKEDTDVEPCSNKNWAKEHYRIELSEGITEVGAGFLDVFVNMEELIIHRSVKNIEVTPQLKKILNNVTIRGWRKTYAEKFAGQYGLKFLQADIMVGWHRTDYSNTKLTIRFKNDGTPYLEYDEYTSGISAGNCGGGTYTRDIEPDFYKSETLESFANRLPGYHDVILKNKDLAHLFKA